MTLTQYRDDWKDDDGPAHDDIEKLLKVTECLRDGLAEISQSGFSYILEQHALSHLAKADEIVGGGK